MKKHGTTYTLTELKDLIGGAAYAAALAWMQGETGITDEDTLLAEADEYKVLFTRTGKPATK